MRMWSDFARPYEGAGGRDPDFFWGEAEGGSPLVRMRLR